jgi:hypothetical protein
LRKTLRAAGTGASGRPFPVNLIELAKPSGKLFFPFGEQNVA